MTLLCDDFSGLFWVGMANDSSAVGDLQGVDASVARIWENCMSGSSSGI